MTNCQQIKKLEDLFATFWQFIPNFAPSKTQSTMENEIQAIQTEVETTNSEATNVVKCLNCGTEFEGKFCPECGQSADTSRFTMKFIWENLQAAVLGKDGGIWFTLKSLFTRPGAMIVEILNGKRIQYFSPFPMLFLTLTIYLLLASVTGSREDYRESEGKTIEVEIADKNESDAPSADYEKQVDFTKKIVGHCMKFYNNHYTVIFMLTLPLFLFAARICYGKSNRKRYYRAEYLVAITYSMVIVVIFRWLASLMYLFSETISNKMGFFMPFIIAIAFSACFRKMMGFSIAKTVWRSLLAVALYYSILGLLMITVIVAFVLAIVKFL